MCVCVHVCVFFLLHVCVFACLCSSEAWIEGVWLYKESYACTYMCVYFGMVQQWCEGYGVLMHHRGVESVCVY